ncbi:MAG: hypothetical protein ACYTGW_15275 [Planctomycetota bacterium]
MTKRHPVLLGLLAVPLVLATGATAQDGKQTAKLSYKAFQKWSFITPQQAWTPVTGDGIQVKHPNGDFFAAEKDGQKLSVDTTANGKLNKDVKGAGGYLVLRSKGEDGNVFNYAVRLQGSSGGYKYASSGVMFGTVGGVPVQLIDLNNNGIYNEYGKDALIVGKGKSAGFLSKVISFKGNLYDFEVSEDGSEVSTTPFDGESGTLNATSGYKSKGKLANAVVSDSTGTISFNLAGSKDLTVPVGEYTITAGLVQKGNNTARIRQGKMSPMKVEAEKVTKLKWGIKVTAEFTHAVDGKDVKIEPNAVHYYGAGGEEYYDFVPNAKSPKFLVYDKATHKQLGKGIFGMC